MDFTQAAEALAAANSAGEQAPVETPAEVTPPAPQVEQAATPSETEQVDSIGSDIDLDSLPEELRSHVEQIRKQFQGDYTRKTQEIAPLRRALQEYGMDADTARQALDFVQALSDQDNLRALYQRLDAEFGNEEFTGYEEDPDYSEDPDPRDRVLDQVQQRLDQMERRALEVEVKAELDRMEAIVRQEHPDWSDDDLNTVVRLAIPYQGDLIRAAQDYADLRQRIVGAHISGKAQVPAGAQVGPGATGHAVTPQKFASVDEAHEAALRLLAEDLAS